ncbi:hypothetical protein EPUS_02539 [Endocarpon pusillum Z07020]|uniref:Uncharacterized protein n=1 Tax=Endocarpon pusillum (strain Z07020 / HMAS-L-300199) TaxID=1263415 RepID=U1GF14_ENDPU|nr:uncharacterized protein EPUS_02539 [Endocarpon pusillum Z07020]ERF70673.1 hypothetical protein EPUS_02539 [Endocarpon pusillum Z07020]
MPPHQYRVAEVCPYDSSSSDEYYTKIPVRRHARYGSVVSAHHHHHVHEPVYAPSPSLAVPLVDVGGRKRASSTTGLPQPNIIINNADSGSRSRSRERTRRRSPSRGRRLYDGEYEEFIHRRGRSSRTPSPYYRSEYRSEYRPEKVEQIERVDYETRKALEKLKIFEEEKAAEEAQKKFKADMELRKAKEQLEKAEAEEKRIALEKKAVEDWQREKAEAEEKRKALEKKVVEEWQREQDAKKAREKKEKEELDKKVDEQFRAKLAEAGYSLSEIEDIINHKAERDEKKHVNEMRIARLRPTYIKVHKKHLLPETLDVYRLPWSYDSKDSDYILIETYVDDDLQEELFAHTRKIRSRKLIEPSPIEKKVIVKINDKKKDKMYLVRKKDTSPLRFGILG